MKPDKDVYADVEFSDDYIRAEITRFDRWFAHTDFGNDIVAQSTAWPDAPPFDPEMGVAKFDYIVKPNLPDLQGKRILDLGCNNGLIAVHMCRLGAREVIGIDSSEHWDQVIRQAQFVRHALQWRCDQEYAVAYYDRNMADLPDLDLGDFDAVIALNCLYYLPEPDIAKVMKHVSTIAPTFLVQCNTHDQPHLGRRPQPDYMEQALGQNGFEYTRVDSRWDKPRKGFIPKRYARPVVVGTNDSELAAAWDSLR